jgi:polyhydroxyalkanoate synthesis repressor PhaR
VVQDLYPRRGVFLCGDTGGTFAGDEESPMRLIRKYTNRKLYDTRDSRYITLEQLADFVRAGEDIRVVDAATDQDVTAAKLAQVIFEEEKRSPHLPVERLRQIIREGLPVE